MAPESERAMKITVNDHVTLRKVGESVAGDPIYTSDPLPEEPTLTCSEVVERLAIEAHDDFLVVPFGFDREKATQILAEWRERRVQELPILEKFEDEIALHGGFGLTIDQLENLRAALVSAIGKANYPRREQIRKGAKHEK
jgi:hypothetical protein